MVLIDVPPERYPECLEVLRLGFGSVTADYGITAQNTPHNPAFWSPADLEDVVARPAEIYAVADPDVLGCAFVLAARSRPRTWELRHLAVLPSARHRGLGETLVVEGVARARAAGATVLRIGIVGENVRLGDWYRRLGFETVSAGIWHPGLPFSVEHLELPLG